MQKALLKIQQQLFSTKLYLQLEDEVKVVEVTGRACLWVVSRGCSIYRKIDFRHVPAAKRGLALQQKLPLISPFKESGHWVDWQEGYAHVWLWNKEEQDKLQSEFPGLDVSSVESIPESAFAEKMMNGGMLWRTEEGYIGQYWNDHQLLGEGWWKTKPTEAQWGGFLKGISASDTDFPAEAELVIEGGVRWKSTQYGQVISVANERVAMVSVAILLFVVILFQTTGVTRLLIHNSSLSSKIDALTPEANKAIAKRDRFFFLRNQNREYAFIARRTQLDLMADVANILERSKVKILVWTYEYPEMELIVADASPELSKYVKEFEALGWMSDIKIDRRLNKKGITIRAKVVSDL